jgi:hypothetical protein
VPPPETFRADPEGQRQPSETPSETCKGQNDIAKFQFRADNTWHTGTHSRSRIHGCHGAGQGDPHARDRGRRDGLPHPIGRVCPGLAT